MEVTLVQSPLGVLALKADGTLVAKTFFPRDPGGVAARLDGLESGAPSEETLAMIRELQRKGYTSFVVDSEALAKNLRKSGIKAVAGRAGAELQALFESPGRKAVELGFVCKEDDYYAFLRQVSIALTRIRIKRASGKRDSLVIQGVAALEEIDRTVNLLLSRVREWYGLHFPEMGSIAESPEAYLRIVANVGFRKDFGLEGLRAGGTSEDKARSLLRASKESIGADFTEADMAQVRGLAGFALDLMRGREALEAYLGEALEELAPNVSALAGPILGAKLIAQAGSLDKLSRMPSSTIQVLGAEKALFRSLRTGARPPKHGVIFQHPLVHQSPKRIRGKVARTLAGKLAIAARVDAYGGVNMGEKLRSDLERRVEEMKKSYATPRPRGREDEREGRSP